ncbi:MAG: PAS domain S-box protein [Desulfuromonadales bacterium]|nr:PAS domain S-box protein [Desulfuromonadales bacterium]NIR33320.1 PAS domain S-box protein [Desulfuromonadales bacterium]NIS42106.1 PAS domain S-box protein [Desulfuromonadales bacterium]
MTRPIGRFAEALSNIVRTGRFEEKLERRSRDEIGVLTGAFNEMIDRLKEQTEHLEESERRFRTLTETARDGIVSFLDSGQIILFNQEAQRIFGYSKAEIIGENVEKLIHPECRSAHDQGIENYLKDNAEELMRKIRPIKARRRDGTLLELELSLSMAESDGHKFYTAILREAARKDRQD